MAGESIDPLLAPLKDGSDDANYMRHTFAGNLGALKKGLNSHANDRRASMGSQHVQDSSRRNSTEKSGTGNSNQNKVPHYLRASTGSCHDFCKYGRKHEFEEKPWKKKPIQKRIGTILPNDLDFIQIVISSEQKKEKVIKQKSSTDIRSHLPKPRVAKAYSPRQNASYAKSRLFIKKSTSPDPSKINKKEILLAGKNVQGPLTDRKMSRTEKTTELQSEKPKSVKIKPDGIHGKGEETNSSAKTGRKIRVFRISAMKASEPPGTKTKSIAAKKSGNLTLDRSRLLRAETKVSISKKVFKKTLHAIKMETGSSAMTSKDGKVQPVKENYIKTSGKDRMVSSEDKYRSPVKLKFRSGKVIDLHLESNTSMRLRFRRARVQGGEDGKGDYLNRRVFKNSGGNDEATGGGLFCQKVVLRHREVRGKRDARGLLNNVIEETASKLVETRKSKVKALVGAFETVISLQEIKLSSHSAN